MTPKLLSPKDYHMIQSGRNPSAWGTFAYSIPCKFGPGPPEAMRPIFK